MDDSQNPQNQTAQTSDINVPQKQKTDNQDPINDQANAEQVTETNALELKKKMEAILAMEGEEGRARREAEERKKMEAKMVLELKAQKNALNKKLNEITKEKEKLELHWIDLDDKKNEIGKILDPITAAEIKVENDIQEKNKEEHATDDLKRRQEFEKQRQVLEAEREKLEKEKWVIEDKVYDVDSLMSEHKTKYQAVLKEEYSTIDQLAEIDKKVESIGK